MFWQVKICPYGTVSGTSRGTSKETLRKVSIKGLQEVTSMGLVHEVLDLLENDKVLGKNNTLFVTFRKG